MLRVPGLARRPSERPTQRPSAAASRPSMTVTAVTSPRPSRPAAGVSPARHAPQTINGPREPQIVSANRSVAEERRDLPRDPPAAAVGRRTILPAELDLKSARPVSAREESRSHEDGSGLGTADHHPSAPLSQTNTYAYMVRRRKRR